MKDDLIELISQTEEIGTLFHKDNASTKTLIYNVPEFINWQMALQLELQNLFDEYSNKFIQDTLVIIKQEFNGWHDRDSFNKLSGSLKTILNKIDTFYPKNTKDNFNKKIGIGNLKKGDDIKKTFKHKEAKIFISHSNIDKDYVSLLVQLLEDIGISGSQLFCSSIPGYDIPLGKDIYDYLRELFNEFDLYVIFVLSKNYYQSPACLNEMGAAWVLRKKWITIMLPTFEFNEIKGAVNPREIALKLDGEEFNIKDKLGQLRDNLAITFNLPNNKGVRWEEKRDKFINSITKVQKNTIELSKKALTMLQNLYNSDDKLLIKCEETFGVYINNNLLNFIDDIDNVKEVLELEVALKELLDNNLVVAAGDTNCLYNLSLNGEKYMKSILTLR